MGSGFLFCNRYNCISRTKEQKKGKLTFSFPLTMTMSSSSSLSHEPFTHDELSIQQSMLFSDSLKDLKHLRSQLYSAAEFFEDSYTKDNQKQAVVDTLKDYTVRALVNTVDHLDLLTFTLLGSLCVQLGTACMVLSVLRQSIVETASAMKTVGITRKAVLSNNDKRTPTFHSQKRENSPPSPSPQGSLQPVNFLFTDKQKVSDKRTASPLSKFPLLRSGSFSTRHELLTLVGPTTSNSFNTRPRYPSEPRKTSSMRLHAERDNRNDMEQYPSKSKRLLKALLSRKSKKDEAVYTFLDEY
ncbi:hypothetical protein IFM89_024201 [Coptis chinensis]|uniref:Protein ABIL2 n=1 Tax=Coptis chinensis TaxID=261450 RepID=A0A835H8B2_9MAGN|nr:hypothetical protein IFM89_024201 [Coptis chinensis]